MILCIFLYLSPFAASPVALLKRHLKKTQLVSTDNHSNVRNTQHTMAVDLPTLCRDDLVALPKGAGNRLQGSMTVVRRVTSVVQFVGPSSGET